MHKVVLTVLIMNTVDAVQLVGGPMNTSASAALLNVLSAGQKLTVMPVFVGGGLMSVQPALLVRFADPAILSASDVIH